MPSVSAYQALSAAGSVARKKKPPIPVMLGMKHSFGGVHEGYHNEAGSAKVE
jgi:hypothetical protein